MNRNRAIAWAWIVCCGCGESRCAHTPESMEPSTRVDRQDSAAIQPFIMGDNRRAFEMTFPELVAARTPTFYIKVFPERLLDGYATTVLGASGDSTIIRIATEDTREDRLGTTLGHGTLTVDVTQGTESRGTAILEIDGFIPNAPALDAQSTELVQTLIGVVHSAVALTPSARDAMLTKAAHDGDIVRRLGVRNALAIYNLQALMLRLVAESTIRFQRRLQELPNGDAIAKAHLDLLRTAIAQGLTAGVEILTGSAVERAAENARKPEQSPPPPQ